MKERKTMGQMMEERKRNSMKGLALFMAVILYAAVLIYTGVHNFSLMTRGLAPDQRIFGIAALLCLEGASVFLPLAIHFWLAPGGQRTTGYILYVVNFGIVMLNTVADYMVNNMAGNTDAMPDWLRMYAQFIFPATPVIIGIGIAFIFLLDPSKKIHDMEMLAEASRLEKMAQEMQEAADHADINAAIAAQARARVWQLTVENHGELPPGQQTIDTNAKALAEPKPSQPVELEQPSPNAASLNNQNP